MVYIPDYAGFQRDYNLYSPNAIEGEIVYNSPHNVATYPNSQPAVTQEYQITVSAASDNIFRLTFADLSQAIEYDATGSDTATTIRDALVTALKANSIVYGKYIITSYLTDVILLKARIPGTPGITSIASTGTGSLAVATLFEGTDPGILPFGRLVVATATAKMKLIDAALGAATKILGVTRFTQCGIMPGKPNPYNSDGYLPYSAVNVVRSGIMWVYAATDVSPMDDVYVAYDASTPSTQGRFGKSTLASSSRLSNNTALPNTGSWQWIDTATAGSLAKLEFNLPG